MTTYDEVDIFISRLTELGYVIDSEDIASRSLLKVVAAMAEKIAVLEKPNE